VFPKPLDRPLQPFLNRPFLARHLAGFEFGENALQRGHVLLRAGVFQIPEAEVNRLEGGVRERRRQVCRIEVLMRLDDCANQGGIGLNSIAGSILGAVSISVLSEALKPLELFKWIIIPLLLILIMIFRPHGLIAFTELNVRKLMRARK